MFDRIFYFYSIVFLFFLFILNKFYVNEEYYISIGLFFFMFGGFYLLVLFLLKTVNFLVISDINKYLFVLKAIRDSQLVVFDYYYVELKCWNLINKLLKLLVANKYFLMF